ncbi:hypothetical protein OROGR_014408 [Orobanche gracilis]
MTRSYSHREKSGSSYLVSQDDLLEGTSARTRPLSYDDIMLKRKNKGDASKRVASGSRVADIVLGHDDTEKTSKFPEHHRQRIVDSEPMDVRHTLNDSQSQKVSLRRKGDGNAPKKNDKLFRDKDEGSRARGVKLKSIWEKTEDSKRVREGENERRHYSSRKKDDFLGIGVDSYDGSNKRKARDVYTKDKTFERIRGKSEIDREQLLNDERQVPRKRKTERRMSSESEKEYKIRNRRDPAQTERLTNRDREKEYSHKRQSEEDRTKCKDMYKMDYSERKGLERTQVFLEESREKRRRSRSREREEDRVRRSRSHSPKVHKNTSKNKREHVEVSSHCTKERSGRENPDVDKKRISTNGSSSQNRRNTGHSSGLGGYSPRKRKSDAAAKTPSPTRRSPEKKTAGWDLQPVEKKSIMASSTLPNLPPTPNQNALNIKEFPGVTSVTPKVKPVAVFHQTLSSQMHAIEAVQLTQATRPMRRLYVENLPPSASEKDLIECINKSLLSYGVNYVQGTQPCISCIIHKEKNQALLEFLTPEDASSALALDGMSFSGSNLKLRRPKDYANVTTGLSEKSVFAVDPVSDVVVDSPHKIFIGGISKLISFKMLLEIARAFGPVRAFHFEVSTDLNEPCAFLEYVDLSVTSKACAGLNGMKLGGRVVSAVCATPEAVLENVGKLPFYGIPEHAKPLLEKPTPVLKLKNVLDPDGLLTLSDSEVEDILEDIKLECSRFGTVKSINVVKPTNTLAIMEAYEVKNTGTSTDAHDIEFKNRSYSTEHLGEDINPVGVLDRSEPTEPQNGLESNGQALEDNNGPDNTDETIASHLLMGEIRRPLSTDEKLANEQNASVIESESDHTFSETKTDMKIKPTVEGDLQSGEELKSEEDNAPNEGDKKDIAVNLENAYIENKHLVEGNFQSDEQQNAKIESFGEELKPEESNFSQEGEKRDIAISLDLESSMFEPGSAFVEYRRPEAACMAAHCLHGRIFDGRVVTVGYVGKDLYQMRFHNREI